jgi:uncharacterized protein
MTHSPNVTWLHTSLGPGMARTPEALADELKESSRGEVRFANGSRALYAADYVEALVGSEHWPQPLFSPVPQERKNDMRFQRFGDRYIVRLESGESVIDTLTDFLRSEHIEFADLSAAGAVSWIRLGYWNAETRAYEYRELDEQMEVVSFQGNGALKDGAPFLHLHGVVGRQDFSVVAGHIKEAHVHPTLEVWLRTEDVPVRRVHDSVRGLDLLDLPDRVRPPSGDRAP